MEMLASYILVLANVCFFLLKQNTTKTVIIDNSKNTFKGIEPEIWISWISLEPLNGA